MSVAVGLPVTAVYAQTTEPGCNPQMWGYLEDQANATRARNKAYEREILNRQQSTLYLTCFDQAMALSAKLGVIFSDNITPAPPPANTTVFPGVVYPDWGAAQPTLAIDLNNVVNPVFDNWLIGGPPAVPAPALFNFLPQWLEQTPVQLTNQLTVLATAEEAIIASIAAFQVTDAANVAATYTSLVSTINTFVQGLPIVPIQNLPPDVTQYQVYTTQLSLAVTSIEGSRTAGMTSLLASLASTVAAFPYTCTRTDDLWQQLDPAYDVTKPGVFYPPAGMNTSGSPIYYPFSPYYSLMDFLGASGTPPSQATTQTPQWQSTGTPDFIQEMENTTDNAALNQALKDLTGPFWMSSGSNAIWPAPPNFSSVFLAQDIINQM